jgi:hypothetical protein
MRQEKATHALQNPDYRFKPERRLAPNAARPHVLAPAGAMVTARRLPR